MENKHSPKFLRQRKFLLVLPVLIVPFLTLAFWAMGGGKGNTNNKKVIAQSGLNMELPGANVKDDATDKLGYYEKAASDSDKIKAMMKDDPYFKKQLTQLEDTPPEKTDTLSDTKYADPNEAKVYKKLSQLNAAMNNVKTEDDTISKEPSNNLEKMMQSVQGNETNDPEMNQINGMLEKILDIQHPDRVKVQQNSLEHKQEVFPVTVNDTNASGFYSLEEADTNVGLQNAIEAVIHETQTVVSGATVKLRLLSDVYIAGRLVPKNNFIFGTASLNGERLNITVTGVRYQNSLLPVALSVYDMDGVEGVYIPGAISRDVAKQSSDNAVQQIGISSLDPSIGMQAAGAGIQAAKSLISKKIKLVKVTVKAGYQVLLKDNNNK